MTSFKHFSLTCLECTDGTYHTASTALGWQISAGRCQVEIDKVHRYHIRLNSDL